MKERKDEQREKRSEVPNWEIDGGNFCWRKIENFCIRKGGKERGVLGRGRGILRISHGFSAENWNKYKKRI